MKRLLIVSTALIAVTGATASAINQTDSIEAEDKPPIVLQVENHEERITDLEDKTDKTQTQVNQNTADIGELQENTGTAPASTVEPVSTPVNRTPTSNTSSETQPEPTPEPQIDPYTITKVEDTPGTNGHFCVYTLENGKTKGVMTGNQLPCYEVGTVLPSWLWPR